MEVPVGISASDIRFSIRPEERGSEGDHLKDEFNNRDDVLLVKPLESFGSRLSQIKEPWGEQRAIWETGIKEKLAEDFEFLSRTRDLEIDTPKTQILQDIVDKMLESTKEGEEKLRVRVVVMRREGTADAFVYPDGTVFISQQLLNQLDTLDEVAAILGHELSHLKFQTGFRSARANPMDKFGIAWLHEAACDQRSQTLLENAGFNSLAFSSAIEKIQGFESRGTAHQSGLSRSSQSIGSHFLRDSRTSHIEQTKIEGQYEVLHESAQRTNLEIAQNLIKDKSKSAEEIKAVLEMLHPRDFEEVYALISNDRSKDFNRYKVANEIITTRLSANGYSSSESLLFIISLQRSDPLGEDAYLINTPESFQGVMDDLEKIENPQNWLNIYRSVFGSTPRQTRSATTNILRLLQTQMFDINLKPDRKGIPITRESLLGALEKISKLKEGCWVGSDPRYSGIGNILRDYIMDSFVKTDYINNITTTDAEGLRVFLKVVRTRGIILIPADFHNYYQKKLITKEVFDILQEVYDIKFEEKVFDPYQFIDRRFNIFGLMRNNSESVYDFLSGLKNDLDQNRVSEQARQEYIDYIDQRIERMKFIFKGDLRRYLNDSFENENPYLDEKFIPGFDVEQSVRIAKFNMRLITAVTLYRTDGEDFYQYLEKAFRDLNLNSLDFSQQELINLCQPLFASQMGSKMICYASSSPEKLSNSQGYSGELSSVNISDYDRFTQLTFIKRIIESSSDLNCQTFEEMNQAVQDIISGLHFDKFRESLTKDHVAFNLFNDSLLALVLGSPILANAQRIIDQGVAPQDYENLYTFVSRHYPEGAKKDGILRELNRKYLNSPEVSLYSKTLYLIRNFNLIGPEGMIIVANQIDDIDSYRLFRERMEKNLLQYLDGNGVVTKIAAVDFMTSYIANNFKDLIVTTKDNPDDQKLISTRMAIFWFSATLASAEAKYEDIKYDKERSRFTVGEKSREVFRSLADIFSQLKQMSQFQRFAVSHKALTEVGGALTSVENKKVLADTLISSLGLKKGFIASALKALCLEGDAKFITFPASNMLGSLLFRAFDLDAIDTDKVAAFRIGYGKVSGDKAIGDIVSEDEIKRIIRADTRDISVFGAQYQNQPSSLAAVLANESDGRYYKITSDLEQILGVNRPDSESGKDELEGDIDPTVEAVIRGVEATGALGIRSLQLATQFEHFSSAVERRLSRSFDSNPGLNKLLFWENLNKLAGENPEIEEFIKRVRLKRYLGGGSLQTTYDAIYTGEDGIERKVIVKMKNPNVEAFIKQAYTISHNVLEVVGKDKNVPDAAKHARIGSLVTDLAQNWCLDDINDKTFEVDDDIFRRVVDGFNQSTGKGQFYAPDRVFTTSKVKSEELAGGDTINIVLKDATVDQQTKKTVIESLTRFFVYQLKKGELHTDEEGRKVRLVHSDPHVGNYIVDVSDPNLRIGVIDRSLYLKMQDADIKVLDKLVASSNPTDFVWSFVSRIMDINKVRGVERAKIQGRVIGNLAKEYVYQLAHGGVNKTLLLRSILGELSTVGMDVPLNLRLMIRNISAFQELGRRYGVDFEALYKEV